MGKVKFNKFKSIVPDFNDTSRGPVSGVKLVLGYLGVLLIITGIIILIPLVMYIFYPEESASTFYAFLIPGLATIAVGFLLTLFIYKKKKNRLAHHEDIVLVLAYWIMTILVGAIPFMFLEDFGHDFLKCVYESTSGFTTTGYTVITDYSTIPHVFLFYRAIMLLFGGVGLILILNSALSDKFNMKLYNADGHSDMLLPNIVKSARLILAIYLFYIAIGSLVMFGVGQIGDIKINFFDSVCYTISCLSLGGFSNCAESIGYYNSVGIECVCCVLMVLGTTNFLIHLHLLRGRYKNGINHNETKLVLLCLLIIGPLASIIGYYVPNAVFQNQIQANFGNTFRVSYFTYVSSFTTCGLSNFSVINIADPAAFGVPFEIICCLGMAVGGMAGSTAGGLKMSRFIILAKGTANNYHDHFTDKRKVNVHFTYRFGKKEEITDELYKQTVMYSFIYFTVIFISSFIMTFFGLTFLESVYNSIGSISNSGLGFISANSHPAVLIISIVVMIAGRIEIVPIISLFAIARNIIYKKEF